MQESINKKSMLKVGTILHDTYRIDSYLSSGGFGNTYVATNIAFEERVAIKEFFMKGVTERDGNHTTVSVSNSENTNSFLEQKEKFKKEARRLRRLKNEHIVKVHDLFDENGTAYYVMDYMDGENLSERLKRIGRPMTESEVNLLLPQILDALKAVHKEGFCHLDIKPSNIMLENGNKVKLIDFGASKQLGAKGTLTSNESTAFAKTPGFAPREQIEQNLDKIGPWTDIYALGATLYCLLTTKYPPMPSDIDDDMSQDKHLSLPMPETAGGLKNLVLQMMKTNRLQRPQSIDAIISAVKSRDKGFEQIPVQQEPLQDGKTYEDEGTIIEEPRSKKETKKVNIPPQIPDNPVIEEEEPPSSKGISPYIWIAGIVFVVIILVFSYREYSHTIGLGSPVDTLSVDTVDAEDNFDSNSVGNKRSRDEIIQQLIRNMVYVEGGTFTMGATSEQGSDAQYSEKPAHDVTVSSFYIGMYEVTQEEWQAVMNNNPSRFKGTNRPVETVSWNDCQVFIHKLNSMTGKQFRLPTEAEWEFAARGGSKSCGYKYSGSNIVGNVAWYWDSANHKTYNVGKKSPNELGLYDMSGNVGEWCNDWFHLYHSSQYDSKGSSSGHYRVIRGGTYASSQNGCRVSARGDTFADSSEDWYGLRLAHDKKL